MGVGTMNRQNWWEGLLHGDRVRVKTPVGIFNGVIDRVKPSVFWVFISTKDYPLRGTMLVQIDRGSGKGPNGVTLLPENDTMEIEQ